MRQEVLRHHADKEAVAPDIAIGIKLHAVGGGGHGADVALEAAVGGRQIDFSFLRIHPTATGLKLLVQQVVADEGGTFVEIISGADIDAEGLGSARKIGNASRRYGLILLIGRKHLGRNTRRHGRTPAAEIDGQAQHDSRISQSCIGG